MSKTIDINKHLNHLAAIYAKEVNVHRGFADIRDGLKESQRRLLYEMYLMGLEPSKPHRKSAAITGNVAANFHPHGTAAIYETLVNLALLFKSNEPPIDPQGNFGSMDGSPEAAERYTEARLSKATYKFFDGITKNAVQMVDNFDGSTKEPEVLPMPYPYALVNGQEGIGWSISNKIAPHNIVEIMDACIYLVKHQNATPKDLLSIIQGMDSPTGCDVIVDEKELLSELETGVAKYTMRAKIEIVEDKKEPYIQITNVPYGLLMNEGTRIKIGTVLEDIKAIPFTRTSDETTHYEANVKVFFAKGTTREQMESVANHLFKKTPLEMNLNARTILVSDGKPKTVGLFDYLKTFLDFRLQTLKNVWTFDKNKALVRINLINGLLRLEETLDDGTNMLDRIVHLAKESSSREDLIQQLINVYGFNQEQAENIADMRIYRLSNQNFNELKDEKSDKLNLVATLTEWIEDEKASKRKLLEDLKDTAKFFKKSTRKSNIIHPNDVKEVAEISNEELIKPKKTKVIIKRDLQISQIGPRAFDNQIENYTDNDIVASLDAMTTDYVVAITKDGRTVTRFIHELPQLDLKGTSERLNIQINDLKGNNEFVGGVIVQKENNEDKFLIISNRGMVKVGTVETLLPKVKTRLYVKKLSNAMKVKDGDEVVFVAQMPIHEMSDKEIHATLQDDSKKSGKVVRKVSLSKFMERMDSATNSGTTGINTKKGALPMLDVEIN